MTYSRPQDDIINIDPQKQEDLSNSNESVDGKDSNKSKIINTGSITTVEAFWNICNTIQGLPILSIPYAIQCGGVVSVISLITVACVSCYTSALIVRCLYEKTEDGRLVRVRSSYVDIGKAVWKNGGAQLVLVTQVVELLLICALYPFIVGSILDKLFAHLGVHSRIWILISGLVFLPNIFLANLSQVAWTSLLVVGSAVIIFTSVIAYCLARTWAWKWEALVAFDADRFPEAIMWLVASYFSQPFVAVIEESMGHRKKFSFVLLLSFFAMTLVNLLMGVIATLTFFPRTQEVITSNLPGGVFKNIVALTAAVLSFASFTLPVFTIFKISEQFNKVDVEPKITKGENRSSPFRHILYRMAIVGTVVLFATIPKFLLLVALFGSLVGTTLEVIFPTVFHIKLYYNTMTIWQVIIDVVILAFGMVMAVCGLYFSARTLIGKRSSFKNIIPHLNHCKYNCSV